MFSEAKVTEIYCIADDFCKEFAKYQKITPSLTLQRMGNTSLKRNPPLKWNLSMTGNLHYF